MADYISNLVFCPSLHAQLRPFVSSHLLPLCPLYVSSMFLDSLVSDAAWRAVYAKDRSGAVLPWDLHQKELEATHPYQVFTLRAMLAVPYFEKALCKCARVCL